MKSLILPLLILLLSLSACQKTEIPIAQTPINCHLDFSNHPRNTAFSQVVQQFAGPSFVGLTLLVDHPQEGIWIGSSGWADIENEVAMNPCHRHHVASIIKSYISVIILQLAEEGQLALDDRLSEYLSEGLLAQLPNGQQFTIRQLLQCRSGMPDVFESEFLLDFLNHPTRQYSMEELLGFLYNVKPVADPGEEYYYGDGNFILLSMLIEQFDGSLVEAFQTRIFDPIGAEDSYLMDTPASLPTGVVANYWDRHGTGVVENISDYQIALAAGLEGTDGLVTTAFDLNLFQRGLQDGSLLSAESYAEMQEFVAIPEGGSEANYNGYGLGLARTQVSENIWQGGFGNHVGASTLMLYNAEHDISIVAVQNTGTFFNDDLKAAFFGKLLLAIEAAML